MNSNTTTPTTAAATPVLELVDPAALLVDRNIRTGLHIDKAMIGSIKENGVLVPITVVRDDTGGLRVRAGHRRTAAAIEAGLTQVPVVILADEDDTDRGQAARVIEQIVENHHRRGVTDADTVAAVEQLAAFGVSVASIARRTKLPKATVTAAHAVAASPAAKTTVETVENLTLADAATVAEFDTDPDLQTQLIDTLTSGGGIAHLAARLREERDERAARATVQARIPDLAWIEEPGWDDDTAVRLTRLTDVAPSDREGTWPDPVDPDSHGDCPGAVAWLTLDRAAMWDLDADDGDDCPEVGSPLVAGDWVFTITHGCTHPEHHHPRSSIRDAGDTGSDDPAAAETRKADRRRLIALNKAADAAATVRREWLTQFCHRKTAPKDAAAWLLAGLAARYLPWDDLRSQGLPALRAALGIEDRHPNNPDAVTGLATTPARAAQLHLCAVLWAHDAHIKRDSWRGPQPHQAHYLTQLAAWGYELSEVEQIITGDMTPESAYDAIIT